MTKRSKLNIEELFEGIRNGDSSALAQAITLVESNSPVHTASARKLQQLLLPFSGDSIRIGITGAPGAGKSTFIESFGTYLCETGKKVAVLAIDPSSALSRGSILGDKTRMERLARNERAFIRPSPSGSNLGGVAKKTREAIFLCEAAGYDIILIETIGVGQSETVVRSMVDFFLLLLLPGAGDELQGIKKGAVELADGIVVNKADGDNRFGAELTRKSYENALHILTPLTEGWKVRAMSCSSFSEERIPDVWEMIAEYVKYTRKSGFFGKRRTEQKIEWFRTLVEDEIMRKLFSAPGISALMTELEKKIMQSEYTPTAAADEIINAFNNC